MRERTGRAPVEPLDSDSQLLCSKELFVGRCRPPEGKSDRRRPKWILPFPRMAIERLRSPFPETCLARVKNDIGTSATLKRAGPTWAADPSP